jgi:N,N'-diacetyllegionaminate synthase
MNTIDISGRKVGGGSPCLMVAEIGINHNGDMVLAKETIAAAAEAGADAIKFQNYRTEDFVTDRNLLYSYENQGEKIREAQYDMFKRCELSGDDLGLLKEQSDASGVIFHSTPTSREGIAALLGVGASFLKNGSDYLTHLPLIRAMAETGLPTVLSTGMATLAEIDEAVCAFREAGNDQLVLLECTSAYPTPPEDVHLRRMPALAGAFDCLVGFSDHTEGTTAAVAAVVLGACLIEKHFTLDRKLPGPDHYFSSDLAEFGSLVRAVREAEVMLGNSRTYLKESECEGRANYRLSCVVAKDLPAGHVLVEDDLAFQRPGTGVRPADAHFLLGRSLKAEMVINSVVRPSDLV